MFSLFLDGNSVLRRCVIAAVASGLGFSAHAADIKVVAPNAVKESVLEIGSQFAKATGHKVIFTWGGSEAITKRIADGEEFDIVVTTSQAIDRMASAEKVAAESKVDFSRSAVAAAVRADVPRPNISTVDGVRQALLNAESIAISSGASGRYFEQLFERLGVAEQIKHKIKQPPSGAQIGDLLANGGAQLGFQQVSELLHAKGIVYLGPLPAEIQNYTVWSAGLHKSSQRPDLARALILALAAAEAKGVLRQSGLEPL
ncbi:ABC transporter substrate-binding protein [Bosea caraganae]|uniref:ABC transporter substrate-binding protein n=1 Tax=Bosea caraganae TaxID=2763117 RepID=A0A370L9P5_9HYPH|nr:substrate-binding domain-containing protein [Bosea caraganae]RDJ21923.1 ABC transporter substrate-binding protein [Bosea caraganae]RDJ28045.1 ABC transporter substrate-binding protein [Bosea caraganae]